MFIKRYNSCQSQLCPTFLWVGHGWGAGQLLLIGTPRPVVRGWHRAPFSFPCGRMIWTVGRRRTEIKQRRFDSYKKETEHYVPSLLSLFRKIMIGFTPKEQRRVRYYGKIPPKRVHNICKGWQPNEPTMIVFRFQHDLHSPRYPSLPAFETIPGLCANL